MIIIIIIIILGLCFAVSECIGMHSLGICSVLECGLYFEGWKLCCLHPVRLYSSAKKNIQKDMLYPQLKWIIL